MESKHTPRTSHKTAPACMMTTLSWSPFLQLIPSLRPRTTTYVHTYLSLTFPKPHSGPASRTRSQRPRHHHRWLRPRAVHVASCSTRLEIRRSSSDTRQHPDHIHPRVSFLSAKIGKRRPISCATAPSVTLPQPPLTVEHVSRSSARHRSLFWGACTTI